MPGRVRIEKGDYLFDGDHTLVGLTTEVNQAMKDAMAAHAWPFLEELAGWDEGNSESNIIHFASVDSASEKDPASGAIKTLQKFMPILEAA
jgi:hypothetical protein